MSSKLKIFLLSTVIIYALFLHLQITTAFTISPIKGTLTIDAGSSSRVSVQIVNTENSAGIFELSAIGITQDAAGRPVLGTPQDEAAQWVQPNAAAASLLLGEKRSVSFVVAPPANTAPGARHVGLVIKRRPSLNSDTTVSGQLISVWSIQVAGIVTERLTLVSEPVTSPVTTDLFWKFKLALKNNGTIEVPLTGQAIVTDGQGRRVFGTPLSMGPTLLPNAERTINVELPITDSIKRPGRYRVTFPVKYGQTNQLETSSQVIWFIPKKFLWISAGGIALVILILLVAIIKKKKY